MAAKAEANAAKTARIHTNNSEHKAKLKQKTERTPLALLWNAAWGEHPGGKRQEKTANDMEGKTKYEK